MQPTLFHYYPHRTFLEVIESGDGSPELVASMLSKDTDAFLIEVQLRKLILPSSEHEER